MALEKGIAELVEKFIAAGRPSSRQQSIAQRREGYIASAVLAGETETRVDIQTIELEGMTLRAAPVSLLRAMSGYCRPVSAGTGTYFPRRP